MLPDNILFSTDPVPALSSFLRQKRYSRVVVLADENTRASCYPTIAAAVPGAAVIEVRSGEEEKNLRTCELIWEEMTELALDRHAAVIVLGGGVLGDMGGFCAATYKRGIDFILVPTTLLAQCDASIGGKLGIDFSHFKNHIGVFCLPALTLIDTGFLRTLPRAELRSGFAEIIKHCLISDAAMWREISTKTLDNQDWATLVRHSVEFKARVTTADPTEKGLRKILNAGHTIGHAVESHLLGKGQRILHGEAIAVGLIAESFIAANRNLITPEQLEEIRSFIIGIFGKVSVTSSDWDQAAQLALQDKKNKGNKILSVLPEGIGNARWDQEITTDEIKAALAFYASIQM